MHKYFLILQFSIVLNVLAMDSTNECVTLFNNVDNAIKEIESASWTFNERKNAGTLQPFTQLYVTCKNYIKQQEGQSGILNSDNITNLKNKLTKLSNCIDQIMTIQEFTSKERLVLFPEGRTSIEWLIDNNHYDNAFYILLIGAGIDSFKDYIALLKDKSNGKKLLEDAFVNLATVGRCLDRTEKIQALIDIGVDINAQNVYQKTALDCAQHNIDFWQEHSEEQQEPLALKKFLQEKGVKSSAELQKTCYQP